MKIVDVRTCFYQPQGWSMDGCCSTCYFTFGTTSKFGRPFLDPYFGGKTCVSKSDELGDFSARTRTHDDVEEFMNKRARLGNGGGGVVGNRLEHCTDVDFYRVPDDEDAMSRVTFIPGQSRASHALHNRFDHWQVFAFFYDAFDLKTSHSTLLSSEIQPLIFLVLHIPGHRYLALSQDNVSYLIGKQ